MELNQFSHNRGGAQSSVSNVSFPDFGPKIIIATLHSQVFVIHSVY